MTLASIFWDKKRRYFTLSGLLLVGIVAVAMLLIIGKASADTSAKIYVQQLSEYAKSLEVKSDGQMQGNLTKQPALPQENFAFLSSSYQDAAAKQVGVRESVAYLASINDSYAVKKNELRNVIFYYQSIFYYGRSSAGLDAASKVKKERSNLKQAAIYTTQFKTESKEAADFIKSIEKKTVRQSIYQHEVTELINILREYKKTADNCATKLKVAKETTDVQSFRRECSQTLREQYEDSEKLYEYIAFYPRSIEGFTPARVLVEQIKKQVSSPSVDKNLEMARLIAHLENKTALIKTLLPIQKTDKQYEIKLSVITILNEQLEATLKAAHIDKQHKEAYQKNLKQIKASLTLYQAPIAAFSDEEPPTFIGKTIAIAEQIDDLSYKELETLSYFDFYTKSKKQLEELNTPQYLSTEMQSLLANYNKALPYFKEYDSYNQKVLSLAKKQEKAKSIDELLERRSLYTKAAAARTKANDYIEKAHDTIEVMEGKLNQTNTLSNYVTKQYDTFLQS